MPLRFRFFEFVISIHALLAESDTEPPASNNEATKFLSTLSLRRATLISMLNSPNSQFLSTLSLRRATCYSLRHSTQGWYFYPRSPCGERRVHFDNFNLHCVISIHALLAESDVSFMLYDTSSLIFLSTLSLRRATPRP